MVDRSQQTETTSVLTFAVDRNLPLFRLLPNNANVNISVKIIGYAFTRTRVLHTLTLLCRKSRSLVNTHLGVIKQETELFLKIRYCPDLYSIQNFEFPTNQKLSYHNPLVGFVH